MNYWKILTILFIVVIVGLSFNLYKQRTEVYNFGDIKIEKKQLELLANAIDSDKFILCDINLNKCMNILKREK